MHPVEEMVNRVKKLRNGELVSCKKCRDGVMRPVGNHETTNCFICDKCKTKLNID